MSIGFAREGDAAFFRSKVMWRELIDLSGRRFGRWTVLGSAGNNRWGHRTWLCLCDCPCGTRAVVCGNDLRRGRSKSCGCLKRELTRKRSTKHGMRWSREYQSWISMKQRCLNPRRTDFRDYGGREPPVTIYPDWLSFTPWFADRGPRPPGCSQDRIDPNGNYEPGNVQWADAKQQARNRRPQRARAAVKRRRQLERSPPHLDPPPF